MWVEVGTDGRSMAWTETALTLSKFWVARRSSSHCTLRLIQTPYTRVADMRREKLFSLPCTGNLDKDKEPNQFCKPPFNKLFAQSHQICPQQFRFLLLNQGSLVPENVKKFNAKAKVQSQTTFEFPTTRWCSSCHPSMRGDPQSRTWCAECKATSEKLWKKSSLPFKKLS